MDLYVQEVQRRSQEDILSDRLALLSQWNQGSQEIYVEEIKSKHATKDSTIQPAGNTQLKRPLLPYQEEGITNSLIFVYTNVFKAVRFMLQCEEQKDLQAWLLADDMGVGKTATTYAVTVLSKSIEQGKNLIVVPNSLIAHNWEDEIKLNITNPPPYVVFETVPDLRRHGKELSNYRYVIVVHSCLTRDVWNLVIPFFSISRCFV